MWLDLTAVPKVNWDLLLWIFRRSLVHAHCWSGCTEHWSILPPSRGHREACLSSQEIEKIDIFCCSTRWQRDGMHCQQTISHADYQAAAAVGSTEPLVHLHWFKGCLFSIQGGLHHTSLPQMVLLPSAFLFVYDHDPLWNHEPWHCDATDATGACSYSRIRVKNKLIYSSRTDSWYCWKTDTPTCFVLQ